ncbi:MAG: hypothetical protein GY928_23350 [Colwellia sp.]|nr:hypothetical protein [Colwellia sp.]
MLSANSISLINLTKDKQCSGQELLLKIDLACSTDYSMQAKGYLNSYRNFIESNI